MSDNKNKPSHFVYHVSRKESDEKGHWTRVGAAWAHQDGDGFTLRLEAMPLSGELVIRTPRSDEKPA
ncbi:MAG: hypothetical protein AAFO98_01840 [Pseudomonadota bacterium]